MWSCGSDNKCCGNCANWGGPRKKSLANGFIEADLNDRGKCYCGNNQSSNGNPPCGTTCNGRDWQLWPALR